MFTVTQPRHGGRRATRQARAVVFAIGYYDHPNRLGVPGEDLPHVSHYYHEPHAYYRKRVVIVGGKNSAAKAALELYPRRRAGDAGAPSRDARRVDQVLDKPDIENRIKEGRSPRASRRSVVEIRRLGRDRRPAGREEHLPAEAVFLLTGYHADTSCSRRAGVDVDQETLAPDARRGDAGDERARPLPGRRLAGGQGDEPHLHRERPVPRGGDRKGVSERR